MPLTKIWIHLVFSTKNRTPYLSKEIRLALFNHMKVRAIIKKIVLRTINGHIDHVHLLIRLLPTQNISTIVQLLKGESAYWLNKNNLVKGHFELQDEYFAVSVSEFMVTK